MTNPTNKDTDAHTPETGVAQLLTPLDSRGVGSVFENRVDNNGVAAVIVQRQKAELRAKQEAANERLTGVLKPALAAATTAKLDAVTKALNALLPVAKRMAESVFSGLTVRPYSSVDIKLLVASVSFLYDEDERRYRCCGVTDAEKLQSFDVFASVTMTWTGAAFAGSPVYPFPGDESIRDSSLPGIRVNETVKYCSNVSSAALARFELPRYVVDAIAAEKAANAAHDSVAGYIMDIRRVLQNTGDLHEQALAKLAEMSMRQTAGGEALLASITDSVRMSFAPKIPPEMQIGVAKV